jgi:uncharacterized repeat protein (TIGR01451 family)
MRTPSAASVSLNRSPLCVVAVVVFCSLLANLAGPANRAKTEALPVGALQAPALKWQKGGCYSSWCETGWYSSPAVADLDGDGAAEVIGAAYTVFILNGADGSVQRSVDPEGGRVWPGVVVADLDADGDTEILTAHGGGYVHVFDHAGNSVWSGRPAENELRGLSVNDLDDDGTLEIVVTGAVYGKTNTWVLEHDGSIRAGWPQLANDSGYAHGVFNDNAAVGDLDGDGSAEIVVPSDVHYICAYEADGVQIPAHAMYGGKGWGKVGVWESLSIELRGWGSCSSGDPREERYRANFAHGPAVIGDVNNDGSNEVVAVGNVYDCIPGYPSRYNGVFVFNPDRSRFAVGAYDWQAPAMDTGAPLSEEYDVIENNQPNPALADLDGDGKMEILFSSYDGRVHAFWLDKTEHGSWPYSVYDAGEGFFRFASEPTVADLDNDGRAEVIFGSWVEKGTHQTGKLHILDYLGNPQHELDLPPAHGSENWNGALAAPTLADIDGDADMEVVLNTAHSGFVAYDLPGTADARVLWSTGRGNFLRTGSRMVGSLSGSRVSVSEPMPKAGETVRFTIELENPGPKLVGARVSDTLPASLTYAGDIAASAGDYDVSGERVSWWGSVTSGDPVLITFGAIVDDRITGPLAIENEVLIDDGLGVLITRKIGLVVNGLATYLPVTERR